VTRTRLSTRLSGFECATSASSSIDAACSPRQSLMSSELLGICTAVTGVSAVIGSGRSSRSPHPNGGASASRWELHQVRLATGPRPRRTAFRVTDQPHHGQHRDGLAGSRLADDAHDVVGVDDQRKAVHRAHNACLGSEGHAQVPDLEQRLRHGARVGRARRRGDRRLRWPRRRRMPHRSPFVRITGKSRFCSESNVSLPTPCSRRRPR